QHVESGVQIHVEHAREGGVIGLCNGSAAGETADGVHQHVKSLEVAHDLFHNSVRAFMARNIGRDGGEIRTAKFIPLIFPCGPNYDGPCIEKCLSHMVSQTAVGTGYKDNRVFHVSAPKLINCNSDSVGDKKMRCKAVAIGARGS